MSNFTRSGGRANFWQAISNLSCCSIDSLTKQLKGMKALAFVALFLFSIGSVLGQSTERTSFYNLCINNVPSGPSEADVAAMFASQCPNDDAYVVKTSLLSGDNCDWQVIYTYDVKCGEFETQIKILMIGGDRTPPALNSGAQIPGNQENLNLCFSAIPEGPTEADIAALYSDNCTSVNVTKTGTPSGTDCEWSVTYTYTIVDDCGNAAPNVEITYSGGDTKAPKLKKGSSIPQGDLNVNSCFLNKSQGPTEAEIAALYQDNCSSVITVVKTSYSKGTDCKWLAIYDYTISDACGNYAEPIKITYQGRDMDAPVLNGVPEDITVNCIDEVPNPKKVSATDNCAQNLGKVSYSQDSSNLGLACAGGTIVRTWTVSDPCGNMTTDSQTITVLPAPEAEFSTPQDYTISCDEVPNFQPVTLHYSNGLETGACAINGDAQGTYEPFAGSCGSFVVYYTYSDACERTINASLTVTVVDNTPPVVTPAQDMTVECDGQGNAAALAAWLASNGGATGTDTCSDVTWTNDFTALSDDCGATGSATVEFTAHDACGNSEKTSATFTIQDTENPSIDEVAKDMTVECDGQGNADALAAWLASNGGAEASDACSGVTWSNNFQGLSDGCGATGAATVVFLATDACGNSSKTIATFTIEDTTPPAVENAVDMVVDCDGQGNTAELAAWLASNGGATASDACSGVTWSNNFEALSDDCGATGSATVEFTVVDACGNDTKTSATFTIRDINSPPITHAANDMTVECDGQGNTEALAAWLASNGGATAYDLCSDITWSNDFEALSDDCGATGSATVMFTVKDECGNSSSTTATFTIEDTTAPSLEPASDMTVQCDGQGNVDALAAWLASNGGASASDSCSEVYWSNDFTALSDDCGATGSATVTFTVEDACKNMTSTTATFTIEDTINPSIDLEAQDMTVECDGQGNADALAAWLASNGGAAASDGCSGVTWSNDFTALSDDCGATGSATVEFTVTDACGNHSKTSATFTIVDTTNPDITDASDMTVECDGQGNVEALNAWLANHGGATASDSCSDVTWSNDFEALSDDCGATGSATVEFTATDACGNHSKTSAIFTIVDTTAPELSPAADLTVECDGQGNVEALNAWLANHGGATASDSCSDVTWSNNFEALSDDCGATGSATVEFTVVDACGNDSKTSATFTIVDTTAPELSPAADLTVECDGQGNVEALNAWLENHGGATASDSCSGVTWSNDFVALSDDCGATGSATVEFTVVDACGNDSKTTATFTIVDTTAPSLEPASDMTVQCDGQGNADALAAWLASNGGASASDSCSEVYWSNDFTALSDDCGATGSATVTFTVEDACKNMTSTTATFTIIDTINPSIDLEAQNMTVECDGQGNADALAAWLASNGGATASDGCSGVTWSNDFVALSDGCGATGSALVVFIAHDDCGNTSKTSATFTIADTTAPEVTPAANLTVECDGQGNVDALNAWLANYGGATASDTCSGVTWSNNFEALSDDCGATGSATVEFKATDECGNHSETSATFTIVDTTAPDMTPAADMTVECDGQGNAAQLAAWVANHGGATASDSCGDVTWSNSCGSGNGGTITFECLIGPNNSTGETLSFAITGQENGYTTYGLGEYAVNGVVDSNSTGNLTFNVVTNRWEATFTGLGLIWYSEVATSSASCNTEDWTPANVGCTIISTTCEGGSESICELSDGCGATGSVTVEFTATDSCGNPSTTSATFTVVDTTAPDITDAADLTVECDGQGNVEALNAWLANNGGATASDTCSGVEWSNNFDGLSDDCGATGSATVEFTATDECGNHSKTSATFTIVDTTAPGFEVEAQNMTVECDGQGNADALAAWLESNGGALAYDNCSGVTWSNNFDGLSDECGATGSATVIFTATDDCGNHSETTATFTIEDTTAPAFTYVPEDLLLECDEAAPDVNATAGDACGSASVTYADYYDHTPWTSIVDGGNGSVDLSALPNGFTTSSSATGSGNSYIAVAATMVKNVNLTFDINFTTGDPGFEALIYQLNGVETIIATSNTSGSISVNLAPGDQFSIGVRTADDLFGNSVAVISNIVFTQIPLACPLTDCLIREFTAVDECGNTSTAHQLIRFQDTTPPVIEPQAQDMTVECDGQGNQAALEAWLTSNGGASATDACSEITWSNDFEALSDDCGATGSATVIFTVKDACGNPSTTSATFTIVDTTSPDITPAADSTVECDGQGNVDALSAWLENHGGAMASDTCSGVEWSNNFDGLSDDCGATGSATVEFTATDACGNHSKTSATFTIVDTTAPDITDAVDQTVECDGQGNVEALNAWLANHGGATAEDTCSGVTWSNNFDGLSNDCGATGSATVEFTATDDCGNHSKTSATFTIEDTTNPDMTEAVDQTVECDGQGNVDALNAWLANHGGATASDGCSGVTWENDFTALSDDCGATGSATVEFTATDECGNFSQTSATFTIVDTTLPVLIGQLPMGESNVNACFADMPQSLSEAEMAALYSDGCSGIVVTKTSVPLGDNCSWSVLHRYVIADECGNELPPVKVYFWGGDHTAPALVDGAQVPQGQLDMEACFNAIPEAPSDDAIRALYADNCGGDVIVTSKNSVTGDNCSWDATYTYTIMDGCGNKADNLVIRYTGGDHTPPTQIGDIPNGANSLDLCLSAAPEGPSTDDIKALYTDNCSDVVVTKTPMVWGDDCAWNIVYIYQIADECGNALPEVKVWYNGGDTSAPVQEACFDDEVITVYTNNGAECPATAEVSLTVGQEVTNTTQWTVAGITTKSIFGCFSDNCTAAEDLTYVVTDKSKTQDGCSAILTVTFDVVDHCGNATPFVATFVVVDDTAPVVTCPEDQDFGLNPALNNDGTPFGVADKAAYADNCQGAGETTDYTDSEIQISNGQNSGTGITIQCYAPEGGLNSTWVFEQTGTDGDGLPTYDGTIPGFPGYTAALYYNVDRWEVHRYNGDEDALMWYNTTDSATPECAPEGWVIVNDYCTLVFDCNVGGGSTITKTFTRTFTANDGCDNVGTCSVTYTWTVGDSQSSRSTYVEVHKGAPGSFNNKDVKTENVKLDFKAYPVPFDKVVTIAYSFDFDTSVSIELYDTKGLLVLSANNTNYVKGSNDKTTFDLSRTANQMFYVKLTTNQGSVTKKIVSSSPNRH